MAAGNYLGWVPRAVVIPVDGKVAAPLASEIAARGWVFPPGKTTTHRLMVPVNQSLGAAAALDFKFVCSSDPLGRFAGSGNARFGATSKVLASGQSLDVAVAGGTAVYEAVAINATPGLVTVHTLDVTNAEADAVAAGDFLLFELTRDGLNTLDTCLDQIVIHSAVLLESA